MVLATSLATAGEEGDTLQLLVLTGIGDLLMLKIDTKRIYDDEGFEWIKVSNNLNNADHVNEDFSNNEMAINGHFAVAPFVADGKHLLRIFDLDGANTESEKYMDFYV
jgi:hypothetical protein